MGRLGGAMAAVIRDVSGSELRLFGDIVARLERLGPETDARAVIFNDVIRLLRGDFGASYVWNARSNAFEEAVSFNMARSNLRRYEEWYQFRECLHVLILLTKFAPCRVPVALPPFAPVGRY